MINALTRAAKLGTLLAVAIFATAAGAQAPSQAQRDAIKSQCRGDYMAHCSSVPPGGAESLQCLQKNMSSLSAGCASAVKAVEPPRRAQGGDGSRSCAREGVRAGGRQDGVGTCRADHGQARRPDGGAEGRRDSCASAAAKRCADFRDPQRLPLGLSKGLRRGPDRRRACAAMSGKEQGKVVGGLWTGGQRGKRRHCRAGGKRRNRGCAGGDRCAGGACRDRAAADAAARGVAGRPLGLRRRRPLDLRQRRAWRRPHRAVPRNQCGIAVAGLQGSARAIRSAIAPRTFRSQTH
jgi:hypothetical protein